MQDTLQSTQPAECSVGRVVSRRPSRCDCSGRTAGQRFSGSAEKPNTPALRFTPPHLIKQGYGMQCDSAMTMVRGVVPTRLYGILAECSAHIGTQVVYISIKRAHRALNEAPGKPKTAVETLWQRNGRRCRSRGTIHVLLEVWRSETEGRGIPAAQLAAEVRTHVKVRQRRKSSRLWHF